MRHLTRYYYMDSPANHDRISQRHLATFWLNKRLEAKTADRIIAAACLAVSVLILGVTIWECLQ